MKDYDLVGKNDVCGISTLDLTKLDLLKGESKPVTVPLHPCGSLLLVIRFVDGCPLFGQSIEACCSIEKSDVPRVIEKCIAFINEKGITEGWLFFPPQSFIPFSVFPLASLKDELKFFIYHNQVPHITCLLLRSHTTVSEGIYRVPGSSDEVTKLKMSFSESSHSTKVGLPQPSSQQWQ